MYRIPQGFVNFSFVALFIVYLIGLIYPNIMEVDASQYASISMEMAMSGEYLKVFHLGGNYLDKPPLLFWLGALSMKVFGFTQFAYRLPTFLTTLLAVYAVFKLTTRLYNRNTGIIASLLLFSCQIYILHNHDVRTDTLLTNFVIIAIWQGVVYLETHRYKNFILAFISVGLAMLAKGPIGAVVPVMALGTHLIYQRDWKNLFQWQWILGIAIVLVILSPMLYGLYLQFDANPLAKVNGRVGVSGIRFFFWEQSFGRITGENVWKDDSSYFFFTHNYLWEFLPWSVLGIVAFYRQIKQMIQAKFQPKEGLELYTFGGFILPFIALSTSHYKLPHYIMVIMPMAAIFTAHFIDQVLCSEHEKERNVYSFIQLIFTLLMGSVILFVLYFVFPATHALWWLLPLSVYTLGIMLYLTNDRFIKLLGPSLLVAIGANIMMNGYFYPSLNQYQTGKVLADWVMEDPAERKENLWLVDKHYHNINFYSQKLDYHGASLKTLPMVNFPPEAYIYTTEKGLQALKENGHVYHIEKRLYNFPNTELTWQFLNPKTREKSLEPLFLVQLD